MTFGQGHGQGQVGHAAYHLIRLDETNTLAPVSRFYRLDKKAYVTYDDVIMTSECVTQVAGQKVAPGLALIGHGNIFLGKLDHFHANLKDLKISPLT